MATQSTAAPSPREHEAGDPASDLGLFGPRFGWVALGFALLTLAFLPLWIDPEAARRGLGCLCVGLLLIVGRIRTVPWPLLVPLVLGLLSCLWVANGWEAALRLLWWGAILGALLWGRSGNPVTIARAILPAGAIVAAWALAQQAGLQWPFAEGLDLQASSTLGNRNTAAQVIAVTALAGAFAAGHGARTARLAAGAVGMLAAVALTLHPAGSRGGMLGLSIALLWLLAVPERKTYMRGVLAVLVAGAIGWFAAAAPAAPAAAAVETNSPAEAQPAPPTLSTVDVRLGLWTAGLDLWQESPVFGKGLGQLRIEFPRVRDPHEHDLSSYNRSFRTEVGHAHNDFIEVLVELGVVGLLAVLGAVGWLVVRTRSGPTGWAGCVPVVLGLALCLTYSALLNAPVVLALAVWVGAAFESRPSQATLGRFSWVPAAGAGGFLIVIGWALSMGHRLGAHYSYQVSTTTSADASPRVGPGPKGDPFVQTLGAALELMPWSDRFHAALARRRWPFSSTSESPSKEWVERARLHAHRAHALAPYHVEHMLLLGELAVQRRELRLAAEWVQKALRIDPRDHEAQTFAASLAYRSGDADRAVVMLYTDPHPRLREEWPSVLEQFRDLARSEGRQRDALRFDAELAFVRTLESLQRDAPEAREPQAWVATGLDRFRKLELETDGPPDLRPWILAAWLSHRLGDAQTATLLGERARQKSARLGDLVRPLVADYLEDLGELEAWRGW